MRSVWSKQMKTLHFSAGNQQPRSAPWLSLYLPGYFQTQQCPRLLDSAHSSHAGKRSWTKCQVWNRRVWKAALLRLPWPVEDKPYWNYCKLYKAETVLACWRLPCWEFCGFWKAALLGLVWLLESCPAWTFVASGRLPYGLTSFFHSFLDLKQSKAEAVLESPQCSFCHMLAMLHSTESGQQNCNHHQHEQNINQIKQIITGNVHWMTLESKSFLFVSFICSHLYFYKLYNYSGTHLWLEPSQVPLPNRHLSCNQQQNCKETTVGILRTHNSKQNFISRGVSLIYFFYKLFKFYFFYLHFINPLWEIRPRNLGKATAAARAALPSPMSECMLAVFSCFHNPSNTNMEYKHAYLFILMCVYTHRG